MMEELKYISPEQAIADLTEGPGIHIVPNYLTQEHVENIIDVVMKYQPDQFGTVRCLLDKTRLFDSILLDENIHSICNTLFGAPTRLGSLDVKVIKPNDSSNYSFRPHVDFPGTDMTSVDEGQEGIYKGVHLALKVFIPLTDLNTSNGATTYIPDSHKWHRDAEDYPDEFLDRVKNGESRSLLVPAGSLALWAGPIWHADLENRSTSNRLLTHICLTPKYISTPHALLEMYDEEFVAGLVPRIQELVGLGDEIINTEKKTHMDNAGNIFRPSEYT